MDSLPKTGLLLSLIYIYASSRATSAFTVRVPEVSKVSAIFSHDQIEGMISSVIA